MAKSTQMEIDDERLIVRYGLDRCSNCNALMIPLYGDVYYLPRNLLVAATRLGIKQETYREFDLCDECLNKGGFPKTCDLCSVEYSFPSEFSFELQFYPKYPDDDTTYEYICQQCKIQNSQTVINDLVLADEIKALHK